MHSFLSNLGQDMETDFYIDIHAHSTLMNGFMYGNVYDDPVRYEKQAIFPKLLCGNADDFSMVRDHPYLPSPRIWALASGAGGKGTLFFYDAVGWQIAPPPIIYVSAALYCSPLCSVGIVYKASCSQLSSFNLLKTSPEYTQTGVNGKSVL